MKRVLLNIGCGDKKLAGFINIDLDPAADIQLDATQGLPFENNSVHGIFSEHFFEHITQAQGAAFLRECRRILTPGGVCRIATPDLDALIKEYTSDDWLNPEWAQFNYNYLDNKCEMLNLALREWEHKWVYNEEEIVRLGTMAGFEFGGRFQIGKSSYDFFQGLEYRAGSRLIVEFVKPVQVALIQEPLVSVLIPSYKPQHFEEALASALNQTYKHIEVVIADDCPTGEIEKIAALVHDKRIRYQKNQPALGGFDNHLKVFSLAQGEYIKFLCDDDMLHPTCIERMVECFEQYPDATLVTSHRQCIDVNGYHLPDISATQRFVDVDSIIDGVHLVNAMLSKQLNFIGEPTTVMFRKKDLGNVRPNFLSYGGRANIGNGDMTMWVNLLGKGDAMYLVDTLSYFRQHEAQEQRQAAYADRGVCAIQQLVFDAKRFGFLSEHGSKRPMLQPIRIKTKEEQALAKICVGADAYEVVKRLADFIAAHPDNSEAHNELGMRYLELSEGEKALEQFRQARRFDVANASVARNLAGMLIKFGNFNEATEILQSVASNIPTDSDTSFRQRSEYAIVHNDLGAIHFQQGDNERALMHFRQAVGFAEDNVTARKNLADLYAVMGNVADAIEAYQKVLDYDGRDVESMMALATVMLHIGRPKVAAYHLRRILETDGANTEARQLLEKLIETGIIGRVQLSWQSKEKDQPCIA